MPASPLVAPMSSSDDDEKPPVTLMQQREQANAIIELIGQGGGTSAMAMRARTLLPRPGDDDRQREFIIERRKERLREARQTIPQGFIWARFGGAELARRVRPPSAIPIVQESAESSVLFGASSSGKTSLACAVLHEAVVMAVRVALLPLADAQALACYRVGLGIRFATAYALAKAQMYTPLGQMPKLIEQALGASILVIDDLGMEIDVYKTSSSAVLEVIHERHAEERRTIVTTNLRPDELDGRYGQGIARRLREWRCIPMGAQ